MNWNQKKAYMKKEKEELKKVYLKVTKAKLEITPDNAVAQKKATLIITDHNGAWQEQMYSKNIKMLQLEMLYRAGIYKDKGYETEINPSLK